MKIRLTSRANREFQQAADFLIERNPSVARQFATTLELAFQNLRDNPKMGHKTDDETVRVLVLTSIPFKIFYEIDVDTITILSIFHSSRKPE